MTVDEKHEQAEREAFGENADLATTKVVGSGISELTRSSLKFDLDHPEMLSQMSPPWTDNPRMIARFFDPIFKRSFDCPGRDRLQCCKAEGQTICSPQWIEREDPEWYAQKINIYLSQVNARIAQRGDMVPALAADEAFELGYIFTEALIKFRWDAHAKRGFDSIRNSKLGGEARKQANHLRKTREETVKDVEALVADGKRRMQAYRLEAKRQNVSWETIRKECRSVK